MYILVWLKTIKSEVYHQPYYPLYHKAINLIFSGALMAGECCGDSFCDCQSLSQHNCDQNEVFCTLLDSCVDLFGQSCEDLGWCCGE